MRCIKCAEWIGDDSSFCGSCGADQTAATELPWNLVADKLSMAALMLRPVDFAVFSYLPWRDWTTYDKYNLASDICITVVRLATFGALAYNSVQIMRLAPGEISKKLKLFTVLQGGLSAVLVGYAWQPYSHPLLTAVLGLAQVVLLLWRDRIVTGKWIATPVGIAGLANTLLIYMMRAIKLK